MTIQFHRLATPSYFGGLPATYDYINNAVSGTPAGANGVLTYGPNIGSYFVGFGDDATSADANRPNLALATNTDFLDNLLHSDLVQMVRSGDSTVGGSPQTSITLTGTGTIWLGSGGYLLKDLFHITDANDHDIEVSGTKVIVASISSGGALGGGFASGSVTLALNVGIPIGVTWHIYYCGRTNLASLPIDAMTLPFMRNSDSIDGAIVDFVAQVSQPGTLAGIPVALLQAYGFSTPYGRLAPASNFLLSCDPTDSGATYRTFSFITRNLSVDRQIATLFDDPTASLAPGLTGNLQLDTGAAFGSLGTLLLQDNNLRGAAIPGAMFGMWPLTSLASSFGDQFPRLLEKVVTAAALGTQTAPSLLRYVNGRWCCTVGDGTNSFGDFSGPSALNSAIQYAINASVTSLHIQMKRGTYSDSVTVPISGDVVIEGVSETQTVINAATGSTGIFDLLSGRLQLKNLSLGYTSGPQFAVVGAAGTSLFMDHVNVGDLGIQMVDSVTFNRIAAVYCRHCHFAPATAGVIAVDLQFTTNTFLHNGYYFDECSWLCADETQTVRIFGASTGFQTITRLRFQGCSYTLGGTATTSSHLTHNTGVLEINPNGGNGRLTVVDMTWVDCFPVSSTGATNSVLARIHSVALGDNAGTNLAILGRIEIRGGRWTGNQTPAGTSISPFLVAAQEIVVDDVIFIGCALDSGGQSSEDVNLIDGNTYAAADWAQFIFAPGAQTVSTLSNDVRMSMTNCSFRAFHQLSNSGDIWFILGNYTNIDGVVVTDYANGGGGSAPNTRVRVQLGNNNSGRPFGIDGGGGIRNFAMYPGSITITSGDYTATTPGASGIFMLMPMVYSPAFDQDPFVIDHLNIQGFIGNVGHDDLVVLSNLTAYGSLASPVGWLYTLKDCTLIGGHFNLILFGSGTSGSGGNGLPLSGLSIIRGEYLSARQSGIVLNPDFVGDILVDGVRAKKCTNFGFRFNPLHWNNAGQNFMLTVVNCKFFDNLGGAQCQILSNTGGDIPNLIFKGNSCQLGGVIDVAQFQQGANATIGGSHTPGAGFYMYGVNTGVTGGDPCVVTCTNSNHMTENHANLLTP